MKIFNFIYSKNKKDFLQYLKTCEYDDIINYYDIINKLAKFNKFNLQKYKTPNIIINLYLRKKIINVAINKNNKVIYYILKNLDLDVIKNIKSLIIENCKEEDIKFNLIILNKIDKNKKNFNKEIKKLLNSEFDKIKIKKI